MWLYILSTVLIHFQFVAVGEPTIPFTDCRITMREPRGVITTPNFPNMYPLPISCRWVIEAPEDKVIAVYFTQFYMREGLKATEYAYYSHNVKMGKTDFGTISSETEPTYFVSNKPVLVLDFEVRDLANIHMRVREFLLDVFGFNITYEMIAKNESVRKDACIYHHCSFTGNCYASPRYDRYYCSCYSEYFGDECQYDPECGPTATRNMCQNGGTCRYYIGSTVRTCECPPGYEGARCEVKRSAKLPKVVVGCSSPDCNITCSSSSLSDLQPEAQKGCSEEGRMRFIVYLKLTNSRLNTTSPERKKLENFKREMERALQLLFKSRLETAENITVIDIRTDAVMRFHVFAKQSEGEELKSTIEEMLKLGKLGSFDFDQEYHGFEEEPALNIQRIEASEMMPVVEGTELTLACVVQGSNGLQVEWFKDGIPIYVHNTPRTMWTSIVPKNSQEQFTALLGFDQASSLDTGVFTCKVSDWGFFKNKSIHVSILSAPQPQLTPMTASISHGDEMVITCLSKEDVHGDFGYTWLKNGYILNPTREPEMVEDLFPAGSRILLRSAKSSATYTCIITSSAGSTRKDSVITVLDGDRDIPTCDAEEYMKVKWSMAASNTDDVQLCPPGYTGDVRRQCSLSNSRGAVWEEPDFSGCLSSGFLAIKKKVDSLRQGYLLSDVTSLLYKVKRYLQSRKQKLHVAEGEPVVDLLADIQSISYVDKRSEDNWQVFLDIVSTLLESPILIRKHSKIIKLHEQIFLYGFQYAASANDVTFESFRRKHVAVEVGSIHHEIHHPLTFPTRRISRSTKYSEESQVHPWVKDSVELDLTDWHLDSADSVNSSRSVVVVFYKNLSAYLPQRFLTRKGMADVEYQLISGLVGVQIKDKNIRSRNIEANVRVKLSSFNHTMGKSGSFSCGMADFSQGRILFTTSGCQMLWTTGNVTLCECQRLGTYALLLTHYTIPEDIHIQAGFEAIAGTGCAICAFFLLSTFLMLLSVWRKVRGVITALKLQVCVALLGAYGTFFCGLDNSLSQDFFPYTVTLIQFFLLTSFSLQLCLGLAVYMECIDLKNIHYSSVKIAAIGWAVPVIVLGATLAAQSLDGFSLEGWWLKVGSNFFYAYTSSILILTMLQVLLFLTVKSEIRNHGKVADFLQKKKARINMNRIKLLHRSLLLTTTLLLVSVSSVLYVNFEHPIFEYFFSTSSAMLGLVIFLCYTFCSEKQFLFCCLIQVPEEEHTNEDITIRSRNNSFKSFLKPEIIDDTYNSKLQVDVEKRNERIKRMYSQIEKASLGDSRRESTKLLSSDPTNMAANRSLSHQQDHSATNGSPRNQGDGGLFCESEDGDAYPRMHWGYAQHPHAMYGSPGHVKLGVIDNTGVQRPLLSNLGDNRNEFEDASCENEHSENFSSRHCDASQRGSSFQPPHVGTVRADVITLRPSQHSVATTTASAVTHDASFRDSDVMYGDVIDVQNDRVMDEFDDGCSLKNSCFVRNTDSLETVVYCEDHASINTNTHSPVPLRTSSSTTLGTSDFNVSSGIHASAQQPQVSKPSNWNMTSV